MFTGSSSSDERKGEDSLDMCWAKEKAAGRIGLCKGPTTTFSSLENGDWLISHKREGFIDLLGGIDVLGELPLYVCMFSATGLSREIGHDSPCIWLGKKSQILNLEGEYKNAGFGCRCKLFSPII